ncbi:MAG: hypothetical protein ACLR7Z_08715 [Bilophila wadsworthia]
MTATDIDKAAPTLRPAGTAPARFRSRATLISISSSPRRAARYHRHPSRLGLRVGRRAVPQKCEEAGITFIGSSRLHDLLGNKVQVRESPSGSASPWCPARKARSTPAARKVVDEITLPSC